MLALFFLETKLSNLQFSSLVLAEVSTAKEKQKKNLTILQGQVIILLSELIAFELMNDPFRGLGLGR